MNQHIPPRRPDPADFRLLLVLAIVSSFAPLSMDLFAPSMPDAMRELGTSAAAVQSTLYIFLAGYGLSPFAWGVLADRLGRQPVMLAGIGLYAIASVGCGLSNDIGVLSAMRFLQGIGAASGVVIARAVLRDVHGPTGATRAISTMFMIMVWIPICAPLTGAWMSAQWEWRSGFFLMLAIALLTALGSVLWQTETRPVRVAPIETGQKTDFRAWFMPLQHPAFVRNAVANMLCITTMLLFLANSSFIAERYYQLTVTGNGAILALFNISVSLGVYLVRLLVPRMGVEQAIRFGAWLLLAGWFLLWLMCLVFIPPAWAMLMPVVLACLGIGMVISLTIGQALVPFTYSAGLASALFIFLQSSGSSLISYLTSTAFQGSLLSVTSALLACSLAVVASLIPAKAADS